MEQNLLPDKDTPPSDVEEIENYFASGIDPDDIVPLWNLKQKLSILDAFTTLFRGEPTGVMVRLHVLSEMSLRSGDTITWGLVELRHHFAYLTDTAFETVVRRLRSGGLISYGREGNSYAITPLGLQVNGAISYFLKGYEDEGLGLLTGIVYAGEAMGDLSKEALAHLLNRLGQMEEDLLSVIESASEPAIIEARERFEAVWKRIEQGTDVIKRIARNQDMDRETHRLGQRVAHAQSRLARVTSLFQRAMNDIDRQRVHLGSSGVTTSDLNRYLMNRAIGELIDLMEGSIGKPVQPVFLLSDLLADVAKYEIVEKEREGKEEWRVPGLVHSPVEESAIEEDIPHLQELIIDLSELNEESIPLKGIVPRESFEVSSYRFSMLFLVDPSAIKKSSGTDTRLTELLNLPLSLHIEDGSEIVMQHGVMTISKGEVLKEAYDH